MAYKDGFEGGGQWARVEIPKGAVHLPGIAAYKKWYNQLRDDDRPPNKSPARYPCWAVVAEVMQTETYATTIVTYMYLETKKNGKP